MEIQSRGSGMRSLLVRGALKRGREMSLEESLPPLSIRRNSIRVDEAELAAFNRVVSFDEKGMHPAYPHVVAAPLHMELLLRPEVPFKLLGLVHLENRIRVLRLPKPGEPFSLEASFEGARWIRNGLEVTVATRATVNSELIWTEESVLFSRQRAARNIPKEPREFWGEVNEDGHRMELAGNLGRHYARVSGDWNPIHLAPLPARAFGFKRHIIHGMWSFSRVLSDCPLHSFEAAFRFRKPVYLPSSVWLSQTAEEDGKQSTVVHCESGETRYLEGWWKELETNV